MASKRWAVAPWALLGMLSLGVANAQPAHDAAYTFELERPGSSVNLGSWSKVDGLEVTFDVVEHDGKKELLLRKRPGRSLLSLRAGAVKHEKLAEWWKLSAGGKGGKRTLSLVLIDHVSGRKGADKRRCAFELHDSRLTRFKKRTIEDGGKKRTVYDIELAPADVTHTCAELFEHPKDRKQSSTATLHSRIEP